MPDLATLQRAWRKTAEISDADPSDGSAALNAVFAARRLAEALGHGDCGGWHEAGQRLTCECGTVLEPQEAAA